MGPNYTDVQGQEKMDVPTQKVKKQIPSCLLCQALNKLYNIINIKWKEKLYSYRLLSLFDQYENIIM